MECAGLKPIQRVRVLTALCPGNGLNTLWPPCKCCQGEFFLSIGTPGDYGILQTTPQMLLHFLDFEMSIQEAIEAPRFRYYEGQRVQMEDRFPLETQQALRAVGHQVESIGDWSWIVGGAQGILRDPESGVLQGGADP